MQLVDEEDHAAGGVGDLLEDCLEAVLELPAVLGAGEQCADVERDHATLAQRLRDVARDDPLREALDDGGLADSWLADQDGIVLRAAREDLDHAADHGVAADHRVEPALAGLGGQVAAVALERLVALLGVLVGDLVAAANLLERREDLRARGAGRAQGVAGAAGVGADREQQVLG